eukprot:TCONS_00069395-protein
MHILKALLVLFHLHSLNSLNIDSKNTITSLPHDFFDISHHVGKSTTVLVILYLLALLGLVLLVVGLKCFRLFVFSSGMAFYWFIIFSALSRYTNLKEESHQDTLIVSFMVSLVGGGFTLFLYGFEKCFYLVFYKTCLAFGIFSFAIVFYTPVGDFELWNGNYVFYSIFTSFAFICGIVCLFIPKMACISSSS